MDKKELSISGTKSLFGAVPYVGTALNELFFEYNGRIKQKRLNHFVEILSDYFAENSETNIENIQTEDFNDLFESVLKRVVTTKSTLKMERYRDILIKELSNPTKETELIDIYLDLISSLSEEELIILFHHRHFDKTYNQEFEKLLDLKKQFDKVLEQKKRETIIIERSKYEDEYLRLKGEIEELETKHKKLEQYKQSSFYDIDDQKFFFYKQRLYSKGLLYDDGMGRLDVRPFQLMNITEFGIEFIDFIQKEK